MYRRCIAPATRERHGPRHPGDPGEGPDSANMMRVQYAAVCQRAARQRNPYTQDDAAATAACLRARRRFTATPTGYARQLRFHNSLVQFVEMYHDFRWRTRVSVRTPQKWPRPPELEVVCRSTDVPVRAVVPAACAARRAALVQRMQCKCRWGGVLAGVLVRARRASRPACPAD